MLRRSLARFGFSFIVVAAVLIWQGNTMRQREGQTPRVWAHFIGAALCAAAGLAGLRERHRRPIE